MSASDGVEPGAPGGWAEPTALPLSPLYPYDSGVGMYCQVLPVFAHPYTFTGWQDETMSWKETCYLSANLNPSPTVTIKGPDAVSFLASASTHSFAGFPVGRGRHTVFTNEDGMLTAHGMAVRTAEDSIETFFLSPWIDYLAQQGDWDITFENRTMERFLFQLSGPRSLEILESATQADFHDLPFMGQRKAKIRGHDVSVLRMGMGGTLSYEVHGLLPDGKLVYQALQVAGEPFGIKRLGWEAYTANHTENGYPQLHAHFMTASIDDAGFLQFLAALGLPPDGWPHQPLRGSSGADHVKRIRNPLWLGFDKAVSFDHDFPGKAALEREAERPSKRSVTLIWEPEDLIDVFASLFERDDQPYRYLDFPIEPALMLAGAGLYQDDVLGPDGSLVGYSSGRTYTSYSREMLSLGCIDVTCADEGTELQVLWGEPGTRQKLIRATVAKFPRLDLTPNHAYDVGDIPRLGG